VSLQIRSLEKRLGLQLLDARVAASSRRRGPPALPERAAPARVEEQLLAELGEESRAS